MLLVTTSVTTRITAGESVLRMDAGIPIVPGLRTLVWIWFVMDFFVGATRFLRGMVPNDLLPFEVVAVRRPIVVTSTRWNRGSLGVL